ncbi:MAG: hypothetical protein AAF969_01625 [Bacteroidota bacterium]
MKEILRGCLSFLLIGLLLIKISAFHVYEHEDKLDDSTEHCEHCLLVLDGPQSEGLMPTKLMSEKTMEPVLYQDQIIPSGISGENTTRLTILFSRPPP